MAWNLLENNVRGRLATGIDDVATAMYVTLDGNSKSYPAGISTSTPIYLTLSDPDDPLLNEIVKVTSVSGANVTTMVRAQRGTLAQTWAANSVVSLNLHAEDIETRQDTCNPGAGAVGAPSIYLGTDTTTGPYRSAANEWALTISGVQKFKFSASALMVPAGTAAACAINFGTEGTGLYGSSTTVDIATAGTRRASFGTSTTLYTDLTVQRDAASSISFYAYNAASAHGRMNFYSARGTGASPANLSSEDEIGSLMFRAWGTGSTFNYLSRITCFATEAHSSTAGGARLDFYTCPNTTIAPALAMRIDQDKSITGYGSITATTTLKATTGLGVWNTTPPGSKPAITGDLSTYNETSLKALLTALASYGLITDSTTT